MKLKHLFLGIVLMLGACAVRPTAEGFTEKTIATRYLMFQVWEKEITTGQDLRIYIEGDGDPKPRQPVAWDLAQRDERQNVIYISRPCQYVWCEECKNPALWHEERFNEEIIDEIQQLILYLKRKYRAPQIELVGYDGGGTIAMILGARIPVARVVTVGGITDTEAYARAEGITLNGLNPARMKPQLAQVVQVHYVAAADKPFLRQMTEAFVSGLYRPKSAVIKVVPDATHTRWDHLVVE